MKYVVTKKIYFVVVLMVVAISGGLWFVNVGCSTQNTYRLSKENKYVGDASCQSCHAKEFKEWKVSDHFKAMQVATDSTVLGDFNHVSYSADGITSTFYKKGNKFFINTQGEDGANHDYEVAYTFGYYPLQQYLVVFPNGKMQVTRQSWDSRQKKWFHQYAGDKLPPNDWLHWTGNAQNWNTMCAECHSTNLKKNYHPETDTYQTTFSLLTVSCESCHGPAQHHIDYVNSDAYKKGKYVAGAFIQQLKVHSSQVQELNTCAPCHARKNNISDSLIQSGELLDNYIPEIPTTPLYFSDGQVLEENYKYSSFLQSKMYMHGVKCSNCHNPHSGKLIFTGNKVCTQCHQESTYNTAKHTFHTENTEASACKSCHMPTRTYMGNDIRHDHVFRVPRPDLSVKYAVPNACNDCHKDKSPQWSADAIVKWYGASRSYHFAEDLILGSRRDSASEQHLLKLIQDTATPPIVIAAAVFYLSGVNSEGSLHTILSQLNHFDAQVRYRAVRALSGFPADRWKDAVLPMLEDKVRAVRIAAADVLLTAGAVANDKYQVAYEKAGIELRKYIFYQVDFASGNAMAGDYFFKKKDYAQAEKFYLRGIQKDDKMNYVRLNLATMYNIQRRNQEALQLLQEALKLDDKNDRIYFNLALLYNELKDFINAEKNLSKAASLNSSNPRVYYNYGVLLQQKNNIPAAITQYKKGLSLLPLDADLNYALALIYYQQRDKEKALLYGQVLQKYYGNNPQYQQLLLAIHREL